MLPVPSPEPMLFLMTTHFFIKNDKCFIKLVSIFFKLEIIYFIRTGLSPARNENVYESFVPVLGSLGEVLHVPSASQS